MSKIHYFPRYSSQENTVTNNTLQLFARIYDYSPQHLSNLLTRLCGEEIVVGIEINQQPRSHQSVPDGAIIQRSFKILVEAKVNSGVDIDQLSRHAASFSNESQKILLLLTRQRQQLSAVQGGKIVKQAIGLVFHNITYEDICREIKSMFKEHEPQMLALVEDYIDYCSDTGLFDESKFLLRIVPCSETVNINQQFGVYFHAQDRGYRKHRFVGIYAQKNVPCIWAVDAVYDAEFVNGHLTTTLVDGRKTTEYDNKIIGIINAARRDLGYEVSTGHRFFCGIPEETAYRKESPYAIQGALFHDLREVIPGINIDPSNIKEIASNLCKVKW